MKTLLVDILHPNAEKLLQDLADLDLIAIRERHPGNLGDILKELQSNAEFAPSMEEITDEVELVRAERYANKH